MSHLSTIFHMHVRLETLLGKVMDRSNFCLPALATPSQQICVRILWSYPTCVTVLITVLNTQQNIENLFLGSVLGLSWV